MLKKRIKQLIVMFILLVVSNYIKKGKVLLEDGITVSGKPIKDILSTCGHGDAYDYMFSLLNNKTLTIDDIKYMHKLLIQKEDSVMAGVYKVSEKFISDSQCTNSQISYECKVN